MDLVQLTVSKDCHSETAVPSADFSDRKTVVIAGNPNAGKTTLFNQLSGSSSKVGNYPGVTVDRRGGRLELPSLGPVDLVDIPGTYTLYAHSRDEEIAILEILGLEGNSRPDAVILIADGLALERSLYLLTQLLEFDIPIVVAVNMMDSARKEGVEIDLEGLGRLFNVPFIPIVAKRGEGLDRLKLAVQEVLIQPPGSPEERQWPWNSQLLLAELGGLESHIRTLTPELDEPKKLRAFALWALASANGESQGLRSLSAEVQAEIHELREKLSQRGTDVDSEAVLPRYEFIDRFAAPLVTRKEGRVGIQTERIDAILTHPVWGSLVFLTLMLAIFQSLFTWSEPFMNAIEALFGQLGVLLASWLPASLLTDLITQGAIPGVSAVVVFLPQILFLFFFLTLLEGSGYMARAAFLMDRIMNGVGLEGRAFVPMIGGYACAIPAIMGVRNLASQRERLLTMMVIPLMTCSARLPVFTLIIAALFSTQARIGGILGIGSLMLLLMYLLSTASTLIASLVLGKTVLKGTKQPILLELPPYRWPSWRNVTKTLYGRGRAFLMTAGRIILLVSIILWALLSFPRLDTTVSPSSLAVVEGVPQEEVLGGEQIRASYAGRLGGWLEPVLEPLGFDWKIGIGLIGAFAAREVFVSTMGVVYGVGEVDETSVSLREAMQRDRKADGSPLWTPLTGFSLMIFFLFAMQCMSTLAVVRRETKSWKWPSFMLVYMTGLAYIASLFVYQGGKYLGFS